MSDLRIVIEMHEIWLKFCAEVGRKKIYLSWDITLKIIKLAGIFFYCKRRISQCFIFPFFKIEKKYIEVKLKLTSAVAFDKIWIMP